MGIKEVVGCFQTILGKNKFQIQFEYVQSKDMSNGYLALIWSEDEVGKGVEDGVFNILKRVKVDYSLLVEIRFLNKVE